MNLRPIRKACASPPGEGCTAAQLPADVKNRLSHRGQALNALLRQLPGEFSPSMA